jgi:hypothetical protein
VKGTKSGAMLTAMAQQAQHKAKRTPVPTSSRTNVCLGSELLRFGLIMLAFIDPRVDNGTFCTKIEYA